MKQFFFLGALLSLFTLSAQVPGYVPTQNLKSWWSFSGNPNDQSGNGNNLTNNGATLSAERNSSANTAYSFDGLNDFMTLTTPSFAFGEDSAYSMSFWTHITSTSGGWVFGHGLLQGAGGGTGKFCQFFSFTPAGDIEWRANKQGSTWLKAISSYTINNWDHWVCVYSNKLMTLYKNGVSVATQSFTYSGTQTATMPLTIGRNFEGSGAYFPRTIDDFGVWNRALTQSEITDLYNGCAASVATQPSDATAKLGSTVKFGVAAAGSALGYQWQKKTGTTFQNISNGSQYAGVTTDTLEVSGLTLSNNGEEYRCVVSASGCADTSNAAMIELCGFLLMPTDQTAAAGATAVFATEVADPTSTFQWQVDKGSGFGNIYPGAPYADPKNDTLVINGVTSAMSGYKYHCVITNGECTGTSDAATLTVNMVGIEEMMDSYGIDIFPNPVKDKMTITHTLQASNMSVEVLNATGQKVYVSQLQEGNETVLDLDFLQTGNYFIKIGDLISVPFLVKK